MADGFIVRRGGKAEEVLRTAIPDINFVSKTTSQIVVTFKNNDTTQADVFYGLTSSLTTKVTLASNVTSSNITFSGLNPGTQYTVSAYAIVTDATLKKIKSEIVSTNITTNPPVYTAATGGTTLEYDSGGKRYKSHTFTSNGTFTVTTVGDAIDDRNKVDYLIVAGGGGSGGNFSAGGGAGGYRTTNGTSGANSSAQSKVTVTAQGYTITIGAGGNNASGSNSSAFGITSTGGGRAGTDNGVGTSGGSGGGGGLPSFYPGSLAGGAGTSLQGFAGGASIRLATGGGGGASQAGVSVVDTGGGGTFGGNGGNGLSNILRTGSGEFRAGGGGGLGWSGFAGGTGGTGGGAAGGGNIGSGGSGTANTGGGAGGSQSASRSGGSGIVIIRYEIAPSV
jgi:hypothetical protein